jgi:hypothetical protein
MTNPLNDLFIVSNLDESCAEISFTAPEKFESICWQVLDNGNAVAQGSAKAAPSENVKFSAKIENCKCWNINSPFLYKFSAVISVGGQELPVDVDFGMRTIKTSGRDILVNGEKFYARGFIRGREAHDHPNLMNLPLYEYYAKNIREAKEYGFNLIRFHSRIPPVECFEAADKLGMFIHIEIRKYYGKYQKERASMSDVGEIINEAEWRERVIELRNHPSLMVYCMGNEIRNPGCNPFVEHIAKVTKELDPTRLFIDTCAHGEFDRTYVDFDVQHMSYFYPFGRTYDMYENTYNWLIYGSCRGQQLTDSDDADFPTYKVTRAINSKRPTLAHEICHYIGYRDLDALNDKFTKYGAEKPWWLDELKKLVELKGCAEEYHKLFETSKKFQFIGWKLGIEAARRSKLLTGFHFLQFSDTERYENSNGIVDCFDDKTGIDVAAFLRFNGDTVLLADLPKRSWFENEKIAVPVLISHYSDSICGLADFSFKLTDLGSGKALRSGSLKGIDLTERGCREICSLELTMPETAAALSLKLEVRLTCADGKALENDWDLWVFPNRPAELPPVKATIALDDIHVNLRYPQLENCGSLEKPEKLMIVNRFSEAVFKHLDNGGDVLMLYRVDENRDRKYSAEQETYYLPSVWDRLKGVIWDRGNNCGAYINLHDSFAGFPHDGFVNLQFHGLIDDSDKINLDDFPVKVEPVMRGVDRPVRDRFDVYTYKLSEFQPEWTMRKFAYAFELKVGKGRLYVSGFNFTGLNSDVPETCRMFETLIRYVTSAAFAPSAEITVSVLEEYLKQKGSAPRLKERKMTQYWQLDEEPLESARYWKESEEYIAGTLKVPSKDKVK